MVDVEIRRASVAGLHALDPLADRVEPAIWWCRPTDDAIVLGSRQSHSLVDHEACRRAGLSVVKRRSGGGAVIVRRDRMHWIDVVLPTGFAPDDIRGSMVWIGERWLAALDRRDLRVHDGGMVCNEWSDLVCFAGIGPGEVLCGDDKVVGLSQRRGRNGIRVQCLVPTASVAHEYRGLFSIDVPSTAPGGHGAIDDLDVEATVRRFAELITPV